MKISMPFGAGQQECEVPDGMRVTIAVPPCSGLEAGDETEEVAAALAKPIGSRALREMAQPGQSVAIAVDDYTRPTPTAKILPLVLNELEAGGVRLEDVTVFTGSGLHRPSRAEEVKRIVGDGLFGSLRVINHNAEDESRLMDIGATRRGTRVRINKAFAQADLKVSIGIVEPHHVAGWSGGAKSVLPGVSSKETILHNHGLARLGGGLGVGIGNPVYEDMQEAALMAGLRFICNVVLNEKQRIMKCFAGVLLETHKAAIVAAGDLLRFSIPKPADVVVVSPGGAPRDSNFWQTEGKGMARGVPAVREGGVLVTVGECKDGVGQEEFEQEMKEFSSVDRVIEEFADLEFTVTRYKRFTLAKAAQRARLVLVSSGMGPEKMPGFPMAYTNTLQAALDLALERVGSTADVVVAPSAAAVLLEVGGN
ncbi:MAG: nickel-dependent lactate racemase [Chloroflexi bacterium]|nr:nickel-dependent lactate racemase [Chloroflexota bacterium]